MPCRDWDGIDADTCRRESERFEERERFKKRIDELAQNLCFLCGNLENAGLMEEIANPRIEKWWEEHSKADEIRIADEMKNYLKRNKNNTYTNQGLADIFIKRAEKVHPVSDFHKEWFFHMAVSAIWKADVEMKKKCHAKQLKEDAKRKLKETLSEEELKALDIKV